MAYFLTADFSVQIVMIKTDFSLFLVLEIFQFQQLNRGNIEEEEKVRTCGRVTDGGRGQRGRWIRQPIRPGKRSGKSDLMDLPVYICCDMC